jgi:hypothetical protein
MRGSCGHELTPFDGPMGQRGQGWSVMTEQTNSMGHTVIRAGTYCNCCHDQLEDDTAASSSHSMDARDWWEEEAA